ncbi:hypothetical protein DXG01_000439 [Tephrocybe rancida]|nr:hypothetical protein DXG01_000439 [Tephrocybe rancida]
MFATALVASLLPALVVAQGYGAPDPAPTSSSAVAVPSAPADTPGHMNVDVAFQNTFVFHPNNFTAANNTQITFWFPNTGLDHSVTQSSFNAPCTYLAATANSSAGFDSGLQSAKNFTITIVDDTKPIWFHCKQVYSVSINAPTTGNTFNAFVSAATAIGGSEVTESGGPVTGGVNGVATAVPASSTGGAAASGGNNSGLVNSPHSALAMLVGALAVKLLMA